MCGNGCGPQAPYINYQGRDFGRKPKPVEAMEVSRTGPPSTRHDDLGTVVVTCPSAVTSGGFGITSTVGGCTYEWAVWKACERAAALGADGIHSIESSANGSGDIVTLRASVFVRLPPLAQSPATAPPQEPQQRRSVEERLRELDKLKAEQLISPEEYEKKRTQILDEI